jgi:hypothetical protein
LIADLRTSEQVLLSENGSRWVLGDKPPDGDYYSVIMVKTGEIKYVPVIDIEIGRDSFALYTRDPTKTFTGRKIESERNIREFYKTHKNKDFFYTELKQAGLSNPAVNRFVKLRYIKKVGTIRKKSGKSYFDVMVYRFDKFPWGES